MSPQTQDDGSLAFARNMKIDDDGNLVSDYGYKNISSMADYNIVGHIVGLDNKIYFFCHTERQTEDDPPVTYYEDKIVEYDELAETANPLSTHWTYNGGEIDGYVSTNVSGEKILTIGEYKANGSVPLKHINLKFATVGDESTYTQAPKCPTANLILKDTYVKTIPNGVYVFFIRYKIRKDVYTNWFMCSRPIFGGCSENITTLQGGLKYINLHKDSAKSFVFQLSFPVDSNKNFYKEFQLGFIISHDEAVDARMWKHFNTSSFVSTTPTASQNLIYFDYEDIKEANIDDLLETTYDLYNVRNITAFKNKLYISNYIESDFNPPIINEAVGGVSALKSFISLQLAHTNSAEVSYRNMKYNGISLKYDYTNGYYYETSGGATIKSIINSNHFNYDVTKLSKVETKEKADVVRFDVFWKGETDPDIALVHNIYNDLHHKVIFGKDWQMPVPSSYGNAAQLATVGLVLADYGTKAYIYQPVSNVITFDSSGNIIDNGNHPWYNLGFTFGFGSFKDSEIGTAAYAKGCSIYNPWTYNWTPDSILGHDPAIYGWFTRDSGFGDYAKSTIESTIQREVEGRSFFAKCYLEVASGANTYLIGYKDAMDLDNYAGDNMKFDFYNQFTNKPDYYYRDRAWAFYSDNDLEILNPSYFSTTAISAGLKSEIISWVYAAIYDKIVGIDESGAPVLNMGTVSNPIIIRANSISVKFKKFDFSVDTEDIDATDGHYVKRFKISLKTTEYTSLCTFSIKNTYITVTDAGVGAEQMSTLMPFSKYQPYVHFVDEHNIITNGVKLDLITTGAASTNADVLYLKYAVASGLPTTKWKSFFISLVNVGDIVMEGFNYQKDPNSPTTNILHCLEIDTMLYNINDNIIIVNENFDPDDLGIGDTGVVTKAARYYSSGSVYPPLAFGNCGYVSWESATNYSSNKLYIVIQRNKESENINDLVKASGYIPLTVQTTPTELLDGYYGSWLCLVKKPDFILSSSCYVSGRDVYAVNRTTALALSEFKSFIQVQDSVTYFVRSNFNLNYLSLTQDINDSIFTVGSASSGVKQVAKVIDSAILSFIYELKAMYKSFSNKYFRHFDTDYKTDFDNTVRVSQVLSDETFNNSVFKFNAPDYYNVPTDRGIIINLFAIGNDIFVHTETSFYKFDGNQTIAASSTDITLQESEPFNTGISQLFDSEYGYGGIYNKEAGCITFDSYIFYDAMSNHIFAYSGDGQVQLIDASIYKLLCYYKPTYCRTLHDDANHRVLFEFTSNKPAGTYKTFTISYNYKAKGFVSLHDLSLVNTVHSRYISYSYKGALCALFNETASIDNTVFDSDLNVYKIFGNATTACFIQFGSETQELQSSPFTIAVVTFPKEQYRETVDSVKYIGDKLQDTYDEKTKYEVIKVPQVTRTNPVAKFYIITDCCVSTPVEGDVNDAARPNTLLDYKGFKYDLGSWNSNYFRSAINKNNVYQYPNQPGTNIPVAGGGTVTRNPNSDNNSLVYGKYFILVFDFIKNIPIKFEEIVVNGDKY